MRRSFLLLALAIFPLQNINAQIRIPGIKIPELGIRTDEVNINTPKVDIVGDLQNPGRIVKNLEREFTNAAGAVDRARLEAMVQANAPALEAWLRQSRNSAVSGGVSPMPPHIRQAFTGFYDEDILNRTRYKIGDNGVANLANLSINYGDAAAIVLIDIVVFRSASDAQTNLALWAHELKHVQQFREWGVRDFAIRYLRSWNGVENDANHHRDSYLAWSSNRQFSQPQAMPAVASYITQPPVATFCQTPYGSCAMGVAISQGSACFCQTWNGQIWGQAR
ncbi:eCIS core domain-containing protein [Massilia niabensis]|uniref:DUF4157 domain-containing protein n=1 Tax=Massilia niabensis TaxID=544910 RepID=A0ABW0L7A2_9BURK